MRTRSSSTQSEGSFLPCPGGRSAGEGAAAGVGWLHGRFQKLFRRPRAADSCNISSTCSTDGPLVLSSLQEPPTPEKILTFEENLEQSRFSEASWQLIEREERIFREAEGILDQVDRLSADYKLLEHCVLQTLQRSLSLSTEEVSAEALTSAVTAIHQEARQDREWKKRDRTQPAWRPSGWKKLHDTIIRSLVNDHIENPSTPPATQVEQSSVEANLCSMGRQLVADMQVVVSAVKPCYPADVNICDFYAAMFHETISARVRGIAEFGLEEKDCTFLLRWVNEFYPDLFQKPWLVGEVRVEALGKLLPEELLKPLEEQYLSSKQSELMKYIHRILDGEQQKWKDGEEPITEDGCYDSPVAYDIIQFIHGMVTSAGVVVGDLQKARSITCELDALMQSFKLFQDEVVKQNKGNSKAFVMATLGSVEQFRDVLERKRDLFAEDARRRCLHVLSSMKETAHVFLLSPVHKAVKPHYSKLGTNDWLNKPVFEKLLVSLKKECEELQGSKKSCHQELMGQLHQEVTAEYVRRLLKGKVKLRDKSQQNKACTTVQDNAEALHKCFGEMGSKEDWLKEILMAIAEVLKLQELPAIQMAVASLGSAFPDLSEKHLSALLKLKANISKDERTTVKDTLLDTLRDGSVADSRLFFSRVQVK